MKEKHNVTLYKITKQKTRFLWGWGCGRKKKQAGKMD
jgi:hypothetical protein